MPHRRSAAAVQVAAEWPLVGREAELERIALARDDATCRGVVVSARAGVGKSRLAREAHAAAARDGALVGWVQATSSAATVPLGAFAGLIPDGVRSDDTLELMRGSADALRERAAGRRLVLGVDDAQLLDPVSAALVLHLTTSESAFVIATVRLGEPCPDAITSLWKDAGARRLELVALSDASIAALVETALGAPVEQAALQWVIDSSAGNAMYARELVLGAVGAGTLALTGGLWRLTRRPTVSPTLADLVRERLAGLTAEQRAPVELLALSEPLRVDELAALAGTDGLIDAEADGLIAVQAPADGGAARLAHPLYGEVVRAELPVTRARQRRLALAAKLQERDPLPHDDELRVARLLLDAGAPIPPELLVGAARAANWAGDPDLAARLAELAAAGGAGVPAALLLARAHVMRNRFADAEAVLAAVEPAVAGDPRATDYLVQRVHALFWGLHRGDDARALLERARDWSDDREWRRRLEPLRVSLIATIDGYAGSADELAEVLEQPDLDDMTRRMTERRLAVSLFFTGRTAEALALTRPLLPDLPLTGYADALMLGLWRLLGIETGADWPALEALMRDVLVDGVHVADHEAAGHGAFTLGYLALMRGEVRSAARWFAESELHFERNDTFGSLLHVRALQVGVAFLLADADLDAVTAARDRLRATLGGRPARSSQRPYVARAEGWALRALDPGAAGAALLASADALEDMPCYAAQLVYEALRAGAPAPVAAEALARLGARCDARLVALYVRHAAALAARDGGALLAVAEDFATLGAKLYGMEAAAQAAQAFVAEGRQDSARRAAARARELHVAGQGLDEPAVDGLDGTEIGLTRRERQLVDLASEGLTNAEIADRLVLSVRTVESHLYRAMQKLGVGDRREL